MRLRILLSALLLGIAAPTLGQPTIFFQQILSPDPEPASRFGTAVDLVGDYVIVGEPGAEDEPGQGGPLGRAFLYLRDPNSTTWTLDQELDPDTIESAGEFAPAYGTDVAIDGQHAVVGAPYESEDVVNSGAAYLFRFDEETTTWVEFDKFKAPTPTLEDQFGYAVAISGGIAVVGAFGADEAAEDAGAAYVFLQDTDAGAWNYFQTLTADDAADGGHFGSTVAVDGPTIVVGRLDAPSEPGTAYVFERNTAPDDSTWVQTQALQASDAEVGDWFGFAVGVSPDALIVGAPHTGTEDAGTAYIFERDDAELWVETARLVAEPPTLNSSFGAAVSAQEDVAVVGAPETADTEVGATYVFARDEGTWSFVDRLEAPSPHTGDAFGDALSVNAGVIAIGSPQNDAEAEAAGAIYLYGTADTATETETGAPAFRLGTPHPNPIRTDATISYTLDKAGPVELAIYDVLGREVAVLERGPRPAGDHATRWSAPHIPAGVYVIRLTAGDASATRKALVIR